MTSDLNQMHGGWWQASDDKWYPPEQHPDYRPPEVLAPPFNLYEPPASSFAGLPLLSPEIPPPLSPPGPPTNLAHSKPKWIWPAGAGAVVLLLVGGIVLSHGSSPKTSASSPPTSNAVNPLQVAASQYEQYRAEYNQNGNAPRAAIAATNADLTKQNNRISSDQTTIQNNQFGSGCTPGDVTNYLSCVSQEQQTAASAQTDETAAQAAVKNDGDQLAAADQQWESVISTLVQQLDSIAWPTSLTRQDSSQLEQSLTDMRGVFNREATDLLNNDYLNVAQDNRQGASDTSDIQTESINLSTALGIPPPPAPATT